jgi:hypothetical protein
MDMIIEHMQDLKKELEFYQPKEWAQDEVRAEAERLRDLTARGSRHLRRCDAVYCMLSFFFRFLSRVLSRALQSCSSSSCRLRRINEAFPDPRSCVIASP